MKPIFLPLLDNGNGSVMASFMIDHAAAFRGRTCMIARASDSHPNRGMNKIANAFLDRTECDIWINIDADIRFKRSDVDYLLEHAANGLPLVYGVYPKKQESADPCVCTFWTVPDTDMKTGLAEVRRSGRGFMLVKREVLEAMKEDNGGPALRYHNHEKIEWDFFPSGCVTGDFSALDTQPPPSVLFSDLSELDQKCLRLRGEGKDADGYPIREWISEDWYFCERARALGFKTMVDTRIALGHVGNKEYRFGVDQVTRLDSNITSWQEIHGWFDYENLYRTLALQIPEGGRFVEVGCWLGRSIAAMFEFLKNLNKQVEVHVVDTFAGEPGNAHHRAILNAHNGSVEKPFRDNMKALGLEPNIIAAPSVAAAGAFTDGSCDAVFIDGDHHREAVAADIDMWLPKVKPGGILCGHDYDERGVFEAVNERLAAANIEIVGRCWLIHVPVHVETTNRANARTETSAALVH